MSDICLLMLQHVPALLNCDKLNNLLDCPTTPPCFYALCLYHGSRRTKNHTTRIGHTIHQEDLVTIPTHRTCLRIPLSSRRPPSEKCLAEHHGRLASFLPTSGFLSRLVVVLVLHPRQLVEFGSPTCKFVSRTLPHVPALLPMYQSAVYTTPTQLSNSALQSSAALMFSRASLPAFLHLSCQLPNQSCSLLAVCQFHPCSEWFSLVFQSKTSTCHIL